MVKGWKRQRDVKRRGGRGEGEEGEGKEREMACTVLLDKL